VENIMANQKEILIPTTLYPSKLKSTLFLLGSLAFVIAGIGMVSIGDITGLPVVGFFGLCLLVAVIQFHPKASYLHLSAEGFTFCSLFRSNFVSWQYVQEFGLISISNNTMVSWNYTSEYVAAGRARSVSRALYGYEAALPDTYSLKPKHLAQLMSDLLSQYQVR
jgi:hypothetical protein